MDSVTIVSGKTVVYFTYFTTPLNESDIVRFVFGSDRGFPGKEMFLIDKQHSVTHRPAVY